MDPFSALVVAFWLGFAAGVFALRTWRAAELRAPWRVNAEYAARLEERESMLPGVAMDKMTQSCEPVTKELAERMGFVNVAAMKWWMAHRNDGPEMMNLLLMEMANLREKVSDIRDESHAAYMATMPIA